MTDDLNYTTEQYSDEQLAEIRAKWNERARTITFAELPDFLDELRTYTHDYSTCVYAMSAAAVASCRALNATLGITGFQAGCVMWEFIKEFMGYRDEPLRLVHYETMLYPQYERNYDRVISGDTWAWLQAQAKAKIEKAHDECQTIHGDVLGHWQSIVDGVVPFGYRVEERYDED